MKHQEGLVDKATWLVGGLAALNYGTANVLNFDLVASLGLDVQLGYAMIGVVGAVNLYLLVTTGIHK